VEQLLRFMTMMRNTSKAWYRTGRVAVAIVAILIIVLWLMGVFVTPTAVQ
jgi:heme/copper-type cytochrome/quinol oxidase subunit 4